MNGADIMDFFVLVFPIRGGVSFSSFFWGRIQLTLPRPENKKNGQ